MQRLFSLCVFAVTVGGAVAEEDSEPLMERRVIADGECGSVWHTAEASMAPDDSHARNGRAMRLHIDVDHYSGEVNYPIGWPRTFTNIAEQDADWSRWDFVDFWVYAETSRDQLPDKPLGFIVRAPDRNHSLSATLRDVRKGAWTHCRFPVTEIPNVDRCRAIQFYISESDYIHGDVVDFWIEDLQLLRYAEPTVLAVRPLRRVLYADSQDLRVDVELTGLEDGATVDVQVGLCREEHVVCTTTVSLSAGASNLSLPLDERIPTGRYSVYAKVFGSQRSVTETVQVVSSPWEHVQ